MTQAASDPAPLDEVMLAMDVVDTLRHRRALIERELGAEGREQDLIARLRAIYSEQGIEVPDAVLANGVAALREDRFRYVPPSPGIAVGLARLYIARARLLRRTAMVAALLLGLLAVYYYAVQAPAEQRARDRVVALNDGVRGAVSLQRELAARIAGLRASLLEVAAGAAPELTAAVDALRIEADTALAGAETDLASARSLDQPPDFTRESVAIAGSREEKLRRQQALLGKADQQVRAAVLALVAIREIESLPATLTAGRDAALAIAAEPVARRRAADHFGNGMAALTRGDVEAAQQQARELDALSEALGQVYTLRIVSTPGEQSGVFRVPDANPNARNHYLIVEAVDASGERLRLPIQSEESGNTEVVSRFGLRVGADVFERVRADKADDGVIQNDRVGGKRRGHLDVEYELPVSGGAITSW